MDTEPSPQPGGKPGGAPQFGTKEATPMMGLLKVIPRADRPKRNKLMLLRQAPSPFMLEAILGKTFSVVEGFDSIFHLGEVVPCVVYQGHNSCDEPNEFANLLWLQALVRRNGFSKTVFPSSIGGSCVVLFGDEEFMKTLAK